MAGMRRVAQLAKARGLVWGGDWIKLVDMPHFQDAAAPPIHVCMERWPKGWRV
jgi:hypothetical protein